MSQVQKVRGKDIEGNVVTLTPTQPYQLSLFQTFLPDDPRYSNSIELFDATPKYFPAKHDAAARSTDRQGRRYPGILPQLSGRTGGRGAAEDRLRMRQWGILERASRG